MMIIKPIDWRKCLRRLPLACLVATMLMMSAGCGARGAGPYRASTPPPPEELANFDTYTLVPGVFAGGGRREDEAALRAEIESALVARLATRGLRRVEEEGDLIASYFLRRATRTTAIDAGRDNRGPNPWDEPGAVPPGGEWDPPSRDSEPGVFGVTLINAQSREPLWRSTVPANLVDGSRREIGRTLDQIFSEFPIKPPVKE